MSNKQMREKVMYTDGLSRIRYSSEEAARRGRIVFLEHQTGIVGPRGHIEQDPCLWCRRLRNRDFMDRFLGVTEKRDDRDEIPREMRRIYSDDFGATASESRSLEAGVRALPPVQRPLLRLQ